MLPAPEVELAMRRFTDMSCEASLGELL